MPVGSERFSTVTLPTTTLSSSIAPGGSRTVQIILTVDAGTKTFTVRRVAASPEPGKSYELDRKSVV